MRIFAFLSDILGRTFVAVYLGFLFVGLAVTAAMAQADDASTVIDIGDVVVALIQVFGPIVAMVGASIGIFVMRRLYAWFGLKIDERHRATIEQGLIRAVGYAMSRFEDRAKGGIPIDVRKEAIAEAARYAGRSVPGALKHFGIDVETAAGRARLGEMLESRFEGSFAADGLGADKALSSRIVATVPV